MSDIKNNKLMAKFLKIVSGQANSLVIPRLYLSILDGNLESALLLNQCVYWSDRTINPDGWFWKSYREWNDEIGLSQYLVSKAVKKINKLDIDQKILETKVKRANGHATLYYRVNIDVLQDVIIDFLGSDIVEANLEKYESQQE